MRTIHLLWLCVVAMSILIADATPAVARINVNLQVFYYDENGEMTGPYMAGIERWDAVSGKKILSYHVLGEYVPETVDAIAMGPDEYLYALAHSMADMSVLRLDPWTGQTVSIHSTYFSGGGDMDFDVNGDLITSGDNYIPGGSTGDRYEGTLRRFDGTTGVLKDSFELESNNEKVITWIALAPNELTMFALGNWGASKRLTKYSYSSEINSFQEYDTYVLDNSYNGIWIGPDQLIYLRDYHNGGIDRFTQSGVYFDRFTNDYFSDLTWIEDKLLAIVAGTRVAEIDPINGSIVHVLIDASSCTGPGELYFYGMAAFSVVPEPNAACLLMCCLSAIVVRPLNRQRL